MKEASSPIERRDRAERLAPFSDVDGGSRGRGVDVGAVSEASVPKRDEAEKEKGLGSQDVTATNGCADGGPSGRRVILEEIPEPPGLPRWWPYSGPSVVEKSVRTE